MKIVRRNTFETNSSSTHSITMCSGEDFDKWNKGELFFIPDKNKFVDDNGRLTYAKEEIIESGIEIDSTNGIMTYNNVVVTYNTDNWKERREKINSFKTQENIDKISDEEAEEWLDSCDDYYDKPVTSDEYDEFVGYDYEGFTESYTTVGGERVVAFGYYGYES